MAKSTQIVHPTHPKPDFFSGPTQFSDPNPIENLLDERRRRSPPEDQGKKGNYAPTLC